MPTLTLKISKATIHFIHNIKFTTGIDESKFVYLMIKYFKSHQEELDKILSNSNIFDKRTNEIIKKMEKDSRIRQNKFYNKRGIKNVRN